MAKTNNITCIYGMKPETRKTRFRIINGAAIPLAKIEDEGYFSTPDQSHDNAVDSDQEIFKARAEKGYQHSAVTLIQPWNFVCNFFPGIQL